MVTNKRSVMTLFSNAMDPYSHQVRIVLAEKGVPAELVEVDLDDKPDEIWDLNPYGQVPTLVDRDLVLYQSNIILEYLEERFPHPPLMSVYPVARARNRLMVLRVDRDWYSLVDKIQTGTKDEANKARNELRDSLTSVAPVFDDSPYFLSDEFSLVDCSLGALLWRLPIYGVEIPEAQGRSIERYMERIFNRDSFQASLSDAEREIREPLGEKQ